MKSALPSARPPPPLPSSASPPQSVEAPHAGERCWRRDVEEDREPRQPGGCCLRLHLREQPAGEPPTWQRELGKRALEDRCPRPPRRRCHCLWRWQRRCHCHCHFCDHCHSAALLLVAALLVVVLPSPHAAAVDQSKGPAGCRPRRKSGTARSGRGMLEDGGKMVGAGVPWNYGCLNNMVDVCARRPP